ncbi:MAG: hypothetical protein AAFQ82_24530, partial [Myxococcota bacterium]
MIDRQLKYGRVEHERRFLLRSFPPDFRIERQCKILDRYLHETRLRLRRMICSDGSTVFKLARKLPPLSPGSSVMGNLYLEQTEWRQLSSLPASELQKQRCYQDDWAVDVFEWDLAGLVLAESERDTREALSGLEPPFDVVAEVTADPFFSGW